MGGRPAKPVDVNSKHLTNDEKAARKAAENALRGNADTLAPPEWLNARQREIFLYVVGEMEAGNVLGNVDVFVLTHFAVAVERLEAIEKSVNDDAGTLYDKALMAAKTKYTDDFKTGLRELSLSPQARAKLGGMTAARQEQKKDPVLKLLERKGKTSSA